MYYSCAQIMNERGAGGHVIFRLGNGSDLSYKFYFQIASIFPLI